jgi:hypothetical protein
MRTVLQEVSIRPNTTSGTISETFIILQFHSQTSKIPVMHASVDIILPKSPLYTYHSPFERPGFS